MSSKLVLFTNSTKGIIRLIKEISAFINTVASDVVIKITIDARKVRSRKQEKFLWGVIYDEYIVPYCKSKNWKYLKNGIEKPLDSKIIHEFFMNKFCKSNMLINGDGDVIYYNRESSTELTTKQYEDYIEKLRAEFAGKQEPLLLPYPKEDENELKSLQESIR
jgi:hypothetical protein